MGSKTAKPQSLALIDVIIIAIVMITIIIITLGLLLFTINISTIAIVSPVVMRLKAPLGLQPGGSCEGPALPARSEQTGSS